MSKWGLRATWLGYAVFLFMMTHARIPQPVAHVTSSWDKPLHLGAYFVLAILTAAVCLKSKPYHLSHFLIFPVLVVFGAFDEVLQGPFGRHPDIRDWIFDCVGILIGLVVAQVIVWLLNHPEHLSKIPFLRTLDSKQTAGKPSGFAR